jgi:hypothetical protein
MAMSRAAFYESLLQRVANQTARQNDLFANLANIAALVYHGLKQKFGAQAVK